VKTDDLIVRLAAGAEPVRPLARPWLRAILWLALGLPPVLLIVWWHGLEGKAGMAAADPRMVVEGVAILATAVSAAIAAFASAVPGVSRRWLWVPLVPLAVWLATVGQGCVDDYRAMGAAAFALRPDTDCLIPTILAGIVPTAAMLIMLRRGAPLVPRQTLMLAGLAVAALVNIGMILFHVGDVSFMVLVWHIGVVLVFAGLAGWAGPRVLTWRPAATAGAL
jgi:hypothetical protein